jgi:hypothetical protein
MTSRVASICSSLLAIAIVMDFGSSMILLSIGRGRHVVAARLIPITQILGYASTGSIKYRHDPNKEPQNGDFESTRARMRAAASAWILLVSLARSNRKRRQ